MRGSLAFLALSLVSISMAQEGPRLDKNAERTKFHPTAVKGTSAAERLAARDAREKLKAASYFGGVKWRNVGPEIQGGRVIDIESPASDPDTVFVAFATGGLFRTKDDGITWESLFDDQSTYGIGDIAVSKDGKTLWVGTGESNSQRTSYAGTGVFKSTDAGKTWANVGLPESHHIGKVIIDPKDENTVYVAVLGHLYSQNEERGLYKTTDGGKTWKLILKSNEYTGAIDVVQDPTNPRIIIASMWDRDRRAWNFRESGEASAAYRSVDGGNTWAKITDLPTGNAAGRTGLALCPGKPNVVYAFVDNQDIDPDWNYRDEKQPSGRLTPSRFLLLTDETLKQLEVKPLDDFLRGYGRAELKASEVIEQAKAGKMTIADVKAKLLAAYPDMFTADILQSEVYRSDDSGKTWKKQAPIGGIGGYYWGKIFVHPTNPDEVFITGVPLLRSRDGAKTWESIAEDAHVDHHSVLHNAKNPNKVWIGNDGGVYLSYDGGTTVRHINNLSLAQATTVAVDNKRPYNIIVGNQDNGTMRGPSTYVPGRSDKSLWKDLFGGDGSAIAVDPRNDGDLVYVAYQFGQHFAIDAAAPQARPITPRSDIRGQELRFNWISPLIISSHQPDILYLGSQKLHRSFNQGRNWEAISGDLTKNRPNGDVPHSTIKDVSESPLKFGLIYVGTDDGNVQMTPNGGYSWTNINTPAPDKWVTRVVASKYDVNTVYVSQTGYREDDFKAYLWKSTDQGKSWSSIASNLPNESIDVVREDPKDKNILYVGTEMGVYVTFDGGKEWMTLHGGLPNSPVHDLVIQERADDLVIASHSRGAWVLPLKWVRALKPDLTSKDLTIIDLADVRRLPTWGYRRGDAWNSADPNAPMASGNVFAKEAGKATVRLLDKDGKVVHSQDLDLVRGFNAVSFSLELAKGSKAPIDIKGRKPKDANEVLADPFEARRPKYVPVGEYTLEIEQAGKKVTKAWKVTS